MRAKHGYAPHVRAPAAPPLLLAPAAAALASSLASASVSKVAAAATVAAAAAARAEDDALQLLAPRPQRLYIVATVTRPPLATARAIPRAAVGHRCQRALRWPLS